jgi:hypothetical protein
MLARSFLILGWLPLVPLQIAIPCQAPTRDGAIALVERFDQASSLEQTVFADEHGDQWPGIALTAGPDRELRIDTTGVDEVHLSAALHRPLRRGAWALGFELAVERLGFRLACCPDRTGSHGFNRLLEVDPRGRLSLLGQPSDVLLVPGQRLQVVVASWRIGNQDWTVAMIQDPLRGVVLATQWFREPSCEDSWQVLRIAVGGSDKSGCLTLDDFIAVGL